MIRWIPMMLVGLAVVGCSKRPADPDLSSPVAAARCQVAAIKAKDAGAWIACFHPAIREDANRELAKAAAKKPDFWERAATDSAALENLKEADFTIGPMPEDKASYGDKRASFRLGKDSFEVVLQGGRWYIADTGI